MTFSEMKKAVGRRASDPNATRYSDAIEDYIIGAMSELLLTEIYEEQAQPLIGEITRNVGLDAGLGEIEVTNTNFPDIIRIVYPYLNPIDNLTITLLEDTIEKMNYRKDNPILRPDNNEGYWAKDSNFIRFYINYSDLGTSIPIIFKVINSPDKTIWGTSNLVRLGYGRQFLYQVIALASAGLRQQVGIE